MAKELTPARSVVWEDQTIHLVVKQAVSRQASSRRGAHGKLDRQGGQSTTSDRGHSTGQCVNHKEAASAFATVALVMGQ